MPCPFAFTVQLVLGSLGEAIALTVTAPLERLTVLLQTQPSENKYAPSSQTSRLISTWNRLILEQGVWPLWQGNIVAIFHAILHKSLSLYLRDHIWKLYRQWSVTTAGKTNDSGENSSRKRQHNGKDGSNETTKDEMSQKARLSDMSAQTSIKLGLLAGCVSTVLLYPLTYSLTNVLTAGDSQSKSNAGFSFDGLGIQDCLVQTIRVGGIWSVYSGITPALMGALEYQISLVVLHKRFTSTDKAKEENVNKNRNALWAATIRRFLKEQAAVLVSCFISFPLETMSRRLQLQNPSTSNGSSRQVESETSNLYSGIAPRLIKTVLVNSILGVFYSESSQDFVRWVFMKVFH
jgi:solute carrier family 25 (mitochondrial adenine nucleotide translocator), member 4/5/6/31